MRCTDSVNCVSGFFGQAGGGLYLYRRINDELQVGVEVEKIQQQFSASIGYQYDLPKANFTMKGIKKTIFILMSFVFIGLTFITELAGMIDNNWTVTGMFEKRLLPMPCMFALCGSINHIKNQFRMGCQISIEL